MSSPLRTQTAVPASLARVGIPGPAPVTAEAIRAVGAENVVAVYSHVDRSDAGQSITMYAVTLRALVRFERTAGAALTIVLPLTQVLEVSERMTYTEGIQELAVKVEIAGQRRVSVGQSETLSRTLEDGQQVLTGQTLSQTDPASYVLIAAEEPQRSDLLNFSTALRTALT